MDKANRSEVPSTSGRRSDDRSGRRFGKGIAHGKRRGPKRAAEPQRDRRPGAFVKRRDFRLDDDLLWFFRTVGKRGERRLGPNDLRRWRRIDLAAAGLWRLCLYFTNPHGFARPLVAPLVEDDGRHAAELLYGFSPHERIERFQRDEREFESRRLYAVQEQREPDYFELAGLQALEKEYAEYLGRLATSFRPGLEAIVPSDLLRRLVHQQFEYRRDGDYPVPNTTLDVIGECMRGGDITWSTWRDYVVKPEGARTILHKRRVPGVASMSDQQLIAALNSAVTEEARLLEAEQAAEAEALAAKASRARGARRKPTIFDWFSSTVALDHSVAEIARASRLPQRRVRELLKAQGCPGITIAAGEAGERWLDSEAGSAFKAALAAAIEVRRQGDAARR